MALRRNATFRAFIQSSDVDFGIADPVVPLELWDHTATNHYEIPGNLTIGDKPVAGATLKANDYTIPGTTGDDGSFLVRGDKTILDRTIITIKNLESATVDGVSLSDAEHETLRSAQATVESAFVMTLDEEPNLKAGTKSQTISGKLTFADGTTPIPPVKLWGYELSGTVVDEQGEPLAGIYVSIRDDEGETWSLSPQTGEDGAYALRFYPIGGSQFSIRIAQGMDSFEGMEEVAFDDQTSASMDLVLNRTHGHVTGTGANGAFTVEDVSGAEYVGYMTGVANGDTPVASTVTWPDEAGQFTITIPSLETSDTLSFYQARLRFFSENAMEPGTDITPDVIPGKLDTRIPSSLPPLIVLTS